MSRVLFVLVAWLAFGAIAVALMRRRGHDTFSWAVLFLFLGPIAIPIAISSERHHPPEPPRPLPAGELDLLVLHDGSADADAALHSVLHLVGGRLTSLTLATAVDFEAASTVRGRDTQREAQARLDAVAATLAAITTAPVGTVVLYGEPATAAQHFAVEQGFELIVTGQKKAHHARATVPVFVGPASR